MSDAGGARGAFYAVNDAPGIEDRIKFLQDEHPGHRFTCFVSEVTLPDFPLPKGLTICRISKDRRGEVDGEFPLADLKELEGLKEVTLEVNEFYLRDPAICKQIGFKLFEIDFSKSKDNPTRTRLPLLSTPPIK